MVARSPDTSPVDSRDSTLRNYYALRGAVSAAWAVLAITAAGRSPLIGGVLLAAYPAWDAIANLVDAERSGGLARNRSQMLNVIISTLTTIAVSLALTRSMNTVLAVYAVWAALAGLFQLATGARRWREHGAQWAMMLSGAQSILAGGFMATRAGSLMPHGIAEIAPYAAFGAFYFLLSAIWLTMVRSSRAKHAPA